MGAELWVRRDLDPKSEQQQASHATLFFNYATIAVQNFRHYRQQHCHLFSQTNLGQMPANTQETSQKVLHLHDEYLSIYKDNLNEVKLGNFPEIEVYVIISCYNHSLFGLKDFHRLVVTPNDLQTAFEARPFDEYAFDCASLSQ